jgi:uncharacterized protein YbjT (DUF2867 family)
VKAAVVGGGISGAAIQTALEARGLDAHLFSRSTGFDVLSDDASARLQGYDVIIEATGIFTLSAKVATDFFTRSTRALSAAARRTGARHILLSIVNCERPELQGYGYFVGKAAQEKAARAENPDVTIIRSTQWFEFAGQNLARFTFGPVALVPAMRLQPVSLAAVAAVIAESASGERPPDSFDVAGPDITTLWDMTAEVRRRGIMQMPLPMPGSTWREFRTGGLLPAQEVERIGPSFSDWLAAFRTAQKK